MTQEVNTRFGRGFPSQGANRVEQEWYTCGRCDHNFPRDKMVVQNGLYVCKGPGTHNCADVEGHAANVRRLILPLEERPQPLPQDDIET